MPAQHPRLDSRDLQVVLQVAAAGSTVKAAASLHLTQSAVSRSLLLIESKLGMRLFDRTSQGLRPTLAGERLLAGAGPLLAQLLELETSLEATPNEPTRVRLVCECYTAYRWLPSAITSLRKSLPNLILTLGVDHTNAPVAALLAGDIDVALLTTASVHGGLEERPLFADEIVFVMSPTHPLASRESLRPGDIAQYPLISGNTPPAEARWFHSKVFGRRTAKLQSLRFPLTEAVMDATRSGMGIAAMSEWIAGPYLAGGDLTVRRLASGPLERPWRIAFRRDMERVAQRIGSALADCTPRIYA
jgi:LysR family transcriptional regulator for metE and metH